MKRNSSFLLFFWTAILIFLAGVASTIAAFSRMPAQAEKLIEKQKLLAALLELERERNHARSAILAFESADNHSPAPMDSLVCAHLSGANPDIRTRETIELQDGWSLTRVEIVCADLDLARLPAFLRAAESGRPPWRLIECNIASSRKDGGRGRVAMTMESLAKTE